MAEVLVTLGIIGIVAAMTLPTIINKSQEFILRNQYKKAYNTFLNGLLTAQAKMGYPVNCYYWEKNPYDSAVCSNTNKYGSCTSWVMADGSTLTSDYNGNMNDCAALEDILFSKVLTTAAYCKNKALENGCLTDQYKGLDKVRIEQGAEENSSAADPGQIFSDSEIKYKSPVWILTNGVVIIRYRHLMPLYAIDINGHKGPNRWGYDIFQFTIIGTNKDGIKNIYPKKSGIREKGGKTGIQMYEEAFTK